MEAHDKKILCINSAEDFIQLALGDEQGFILGLETRSQRKGIVLIPQLIENCLKNAKVELEDVGKLACVIGPGSFTGLRISISILTGISLTKKIPMGGINYLELLAYNAFNFVPGTIFVILYAKINMVYVQGFTGPDPISPVTSPMVCKLSQLDKLFKGYKDVYVLGSGVRKYNDLFKRVGFKVLGPIFDRPCLDSLFKYSTKINYSNELLIPMYLRPSDAEENLKDIAKKRGISI